MIHTIGWELGVDVGYQESLMIPGVMKSDDEKFKAACAKQMDLEFIDTV